MQIRAIATGVLILLTTFGCTKPLTKSDVKEFLDDFESAAQEHDVDEISKHLADNLEIAMSVTVDGESHSVSLNKRQYISMLKEAWAIAKNYERKVRNQEIVIQEDQAMVSDETVESMTINGKYTKASATVVTTIERRNGVLLVTKIEVEQ